MKIINQETGRKMHVAFVEKCDDPVKELAEWCRIYNLGTPKHVQRAAIMASKEKSEAWDNEAYWCRTDANNEVVIAVCKCGTAHSGVSVSGMI